MPGFQGTQAETLALLHLKVTVIFIKHHIRSYQVIYHIRSLLLKTSRASHLSRNRVLSPMACTRLTWSGPQTLYGLPLLSLPSSFTWAAAILTSLPFPNTPFQPLRSRGPTHLSQNSYPYPDSFPSKKLTPSAISHCCLLYHLSQALPAKIHTPLGLLFCSLVNPQHLAYVGPQ